MKCDSKGRYGAQNYITKDMYHTIMKLVLLNMIKEQETYTYSMLKHVAKIAKTRHFPHGGNVKNDIYNTVAALENAGYIRVQVRLDGRKAKKYYSITPRGMAALKDSRKALSSALKSVNSILSK